MRSSAPPENMLKSPRMPPWFCLKSAANLVRVDARHRNVRADAVDDYRDQHETAGEHLRARPARLPALPEQRIKSPSFHSVVSALLSSALLLRPCRRRRFDRFAGTLDDCRAPLTVTGPCPVRRTGSPARTLHVAATRRWPPSARRGRSRRPSTLAQFADSAPRRSRGRCAR